MPSPARVFGYAGGVRSLRAETKVALTLLLSGLALAVLRVAVRSGGFAWPGRAAVSDVLGCLAAAAALQAVLTLRSLSDGAPRARELDDALAAVAAAVWLVALVPPRPTNYLAAATDDFVRAYFPACLLAVTLMRLACRARGPSLPATTPSALVRLVARHLLVVAVTLPALGALVHLVSQGPGADAVWRRSLLLAGGCAAAAAAAKALSVGLARRERTPGS